MEDAVCAVSELEGFPGVLFLGVFDGHGGDFASDFASKNLLPVLLEDTEKLRKALEDPEGNAGFFKSGFLACDRKLRSEVESITGETSGRKGIRRAGCTAVTCFVTPSHVIVANAGDSRCILTRDGNVFQMNIEHTPMDPREAKRVYEAGSFISQVGHRYCVAVTVTLTDWQSHWQPQVMHRARCLVARIRLLLMPCAHQ